MGYYVSTEDVDVFVPAEVAESAVMMLDAMSLGACTLEGAPPVQALAEVLGNNGFDVSDTAAGVRINWYNDKSCNEGSVLVALAPFVAEGSFMEWRGEEGERWRDVVQSGVVVHQFVESVNWADRGQSVPPQFLTFVPVTFRPSDVEMVTGHLVCDGMLTPGQAATLTASLFKGRYFRPCWLDLAGLGGESTGERWHELDVEAVANVAAGEQLHGSGMRLEGGAVSDFVDRVRRANAAGWN